MHLESGPDRNHISCQSSDCTCPHLEPTTSRVYSQPWLRAVVRDKRGLAHRASEGARQAATILQASVLSMGSEPSANQVNGKVVTPITYNKGQDWDYLRPPQHGHEWKTKQL